MGYESTSYKEETNVNKIKSAPRPTNKKQVRSFMGLAGYYRDFIPNFAAITASLSDLTRKGQPNRVKWGDAQEKAYQIIKTLLVSEPILHLPNPKKSPSSENRCFRLWRGSSFNARTRR